MSTIELSRQADFYLQHSALAAEVAQRLLNRLSYLKLDPARILDLGAGTGILTRACQARFPQAQVTALDNDAAMLAKLMSHEDELAGHAVSQARQSDENEQTNTDTAPVPLIPIKTVTADATDLPIASGSIDLVVANLMLYQCEDIAAVFAEVARVLAPNGVLMFSSFGPDTLKELRASWQSLMGDVPAPAFHDMHDLGDLMLGQGLIDPVMDMEFVKVEYSSFKRLHQAAKALGLPRFYGGRGLGSFGRYRWQRWADDYDTCEQEERVSATVELVYGHASQTPVPVGKRRGNEVHIPPQCGAPQATLR